MDSKSIVVVVVCVLLIGLWSFVLVPKLYPPNPLPPGGTNAPGAAELPANPAPVAPPIPAPLRPPAEAPTLMVNSNQPERLVQVVKDNVRYTFTSYGGGLKLVELLSYPETAPTGWSRRRETIQPAMLDADTAAPTLALLGGATLQGDGIFKLTGTTNGVRAEKPLGNGLSIVKDFEVTSNYLVAATVRLENHSERPLELPPQQWFVGTATPMNPSDRGTAVGVMWYSGAKAIDTGASYFSSRGFACTPRIPPAQYLAGSSNVVWVALHNQYFTLAAMPQPPAEAVVVRRVELPRHGADQADLESTNTPPPEGYQAALVYPGQTLAPNQGLERRLFLYCGPKEYRLLARIGSRFDNNLDLVMDFGWSGFVSKALLIGMNWLHYALRLSYGWAVVAITIVIKLLFWPLTQASTRSMKRMQALQPQLKALQEKLKDDPDKMRRKMMEFYKEHKVNPMSGCLPMMIQIPVFFGFYRMLASAIELRGARFLWVRDLAKPDTLFVIPGWGMPFNLLPLLMAGTMLWQSHLTPPSPGMDPTQAKIMRYLPLIFMVTFYSLSSGLNLYWTVNNLLSIAQTKLTKTMQEPPPSAKAPVLTPAPKRRK
jgi:YidC/Oxa1 family membrane protein insertase